MKAPEENQNVVRQLPATDQGRSPWLYRWAVVVLGLVWPLVWVGSLVTTQDAGMSVPDWPNTYGDNLLLYPIETWLSGPFDLFIEHGHRLLAVLVGIVAIVTVVVAFRAERRRWVQVWAVVGLLMIIGQGVLGGMRVVLGDRALAMAHGCTAPIVFAQFTFLAVVTSPWWHGRQKIEVPSQSDSNAAGESDAESDIKPVRVATWSPAILALLAYLQLVLGAMLRHGSMTVSPKQFTHTVATHVLLAFLIWGFCGLVILRLRGCGEKTLSRPALVLLGLLAVQILLGLSTWVVNYGFPMFQDYRYAAGYLVNAKSFWGSFVVCGHVATGSLIFAIAVMLWVRARRVRFCNSYS